jgi:ribose 5-phosphate isomerase A
MSLDDEKRMVAHAAALLVHDGMRVGLGTGTTVAHLLEALAQRRVRATYVASSPRTHQAASALGLQVDHLDHWTKLDLAIDGADQIAADGWVAKGAGGALTREKLLAVSADRFVIIADSSKSVERIHSPIALELLAFGLSSTLFRLLHAQLREAAPTPDGGVLADFTGEVADAGALAELLANTPGVVEHGLFAPALVTDVFIGDANTVRRDKGSQSS